MQGGGIIEPGLSTAALSIDPEYTEDDLNEMTKAQIAQLASELGYEVSSSATKQVMIEQFLAAQAGD